jgi:hypothetical protein
VRNGTEWCSTQNYDACGYIGDLCVEDTLTNENGSGVKPSEVVMSKTTEAAGASQDNVSAIALDSVADVGEPVVLAIRATLARRGFPDVRYEVRAARDGFSFRIFENGKAVRTYWPRYTPQQLSGSERRMTIQKAFKRSLVKKFADYTVMDLLVGKRSLAD